MEGWRLMPITESDVAGLRDGDVISTSGDKIGSMGQVYLDDETGEPTFVTVNTGLFGLKQSFVPLQGARVQDRDLVVNYDKETVKDAPRIDDDGSLTPEEEDELYSYYGLGGAGTTTDGYDTRTETGTTPGTTTDTGTTTTTTDTGYTGTLASETTSDAGYAARGDDDAMTLSEERQNAGTQTREPGRARLRKYMMTENRTQTAPVQREERMDQPIPDETGSDDTSGAATTDVDVDRPDRRAT
jgi:hypothetical protein